MASVEYITKLTQTFEDITQNQYRIHLVLCVCCLLTGQNFECEGVLLLDGVCEEEASIAAVISVSVFGQNVGEVQVPIQTHGDSLILRDRSHSWRPQEDGQRKMEKGKEREKTFYLYSS